MEGGRGLLGTFDLNLGHCVNEWWRHGLCICFPYANIGELTSQVHTPRLAVTCLVIYGQDE